MLILGQVKDCWNYFSLQSLLVSCCKVFKNLFYLFVRLRLFWVDEKHQNWLVWFLIYFRNEWISDNFSQYVILLFFFSRNLFTCVFWIDSFHSDVFDELDEILFTWLTMVLNFVVKPSELEVPVIGFCQNDSVVKSLTFLVLQWLYWVVKVFA